MTPLPASALESMSFLAGHWRADLDGGAIEEVWLAPDCGVAQGSVRLVKDGEVHTIELIVVSAEDDRVVLRFNHFNRDLSTWERDGPITLTLTDAAPGEAIFKNLDDEPKHAEEVGYRLNSKTSLTSWIVALDRTRTRHAFIYQRVA